MKPKVAFFSFTSCEGCQLMFLNLEDEILDRRTSGSEPA